MTDVREQIIEQLVTLLGNVTGITKVYRDRGETITDLPAVIVLDGKEALFNPEQLKQRKFHKMPPALFVLEPQIFIILRPRDNLTNTEVDGVPAPIGPELSAYRLQVLDAVINDPTLLSLLTVNGQIIYKGCDTDMYSGGSMVGQLQMHFELTYVLDPTKF